MRHGLTFKRRPASTMSRQDVAILQLTRQTQRTFRSWPSLAATQMIHIRQ
jgi:hypothetical protein